MHNVPVGTQKWKGGRKEKFTFDNDTDAEVKIQKIADPFPFQKKSPIKLKAHKKVNCQLIDEKGDFSYGTDPADCSPLGNPKNVIIS